MRPDKSHLTAVSRKEMSLPLQHIMKKYTIHHKKILDYGCGRGEDVRQLLSRAIKVEGYDPYYQPERPAGTFSVVLCTYVLNVLDPRKVDDVIEDVFKYLNKWGVAFFTVRRNIRKEGFTSKGTQQWMVHLPFEKELETSEFCIYKVKKTW